jgi:hypothetical protein
MDKMGIAPDKRWSRHTLSDTKRLEIEAMLGIEHSASSTSAQHKH